jgi:hypothetical protein
VACLPSSATPLLLLPFVCPNFPYKKIIKKCCFEDFLFVYNHISG